MIRLYRIIPFILFFVSPVTRVTAQIELPLIFQSGMVLQRDDSIPVWGKAGNLSTVNVELNGIADSTITDGTGAWYLLLPPMSAGGPFELSITSGTDQRMLTDVYIGDVWLASGQSNMAWKLADSDPPDNEIDPSPNYEIRQFLVQHALRPSISEDVPANSKWMPADQSNSGQFTAVGFYFAKYLYDFLNIPIGIINSSYGGTTIESWTSASVLGYDENDIILGDGSSYLQPTLTYNAMLYPLRNVPIKGVIWYQGESNAGSRETAVLYREQFKTLIHSWRELWGNENLPFLWVQLPNFNTEANEDAPGTWDAWPLIRESQSTALELSGTGEAVTIELGEEDIHPTNKQPVGKRLSWVARKIAYGDTIPFSGPRYKKHDLLDNGKVRIAFDHTGNGLISIDAEPLRWFSIVRDNGSVVKANAIIENNAVVVWHDDVPDPKAIRYAWETNPVGVNFYNTDSLPAAPFFIYTDTLAININTFVASDSHIDRGESTMLRWDVSGNAIVELNHIPVNAKSAIRVWPEQDSVFTLYAQDPLSNDNNASKTITINVRQPIPTITIEADSADILPLDSSLIISAIVSAEAGAPIEEVAFYINDTLAGEDFNEPYEYNWTAKDTGQFILTARVSNEMGTENWSEPLYFAVKEMEFIKYEAEDAGVTNGAIIKTDPDVSSGKYLDLMTGWTVTFDSVFTYTSGTHLLYMRYLLNYGSPKLQRLLVNEREPENILFTASDRENWYDYKTSIQLDSGMNSIRLESVWDYMSLDYILVGSEIYALPADTTDEDTIAVNLKKNVLQETFYIRAYPNPFQSNIEIEVNLTERDELLVELFDMSGRKIRTVFAGEPEPGLLIFTLSVPASDGNLFFLRCRYKDLVRVEKLSRLY